MLHMLLSLIYWQSKFKNNENPLAILYYHHVFKTKNQYHPDDLSEVEFKAQIRFLTKYFNILDLTEAVILLKNKSLPPKSLVISFDDGYIDNYLVAAPILKSFDCPATFFIATGGIEEGLLWNDKLEQLIKNTSNQSISFNIINKELNISNAEDKINAFQLLQGELKFLSHQQRSEKLDQLSCELGNVTFERSMMKEEHIKTLHQQGFTIGAHTHNHTILSTENESMVKQELIENKSRLEKIIGNKVELIAYPNGLYKRDFTDEHCRIVIDLGFSAGFSTNDGGAISSTNKYTIPRFMPYRKQLPLFALSIAKIAGEHV